MEAVEAKSGLRTVVASLNATFDWVRVCVLLLLLVDD